MGIGLFGDCQSTNLRPVNHYFPQIARRTFLLGVDRFSTVGMSGEIKEKKEKERAKQQRQKQNRFGTKP